MYFHCTDLLQGVSFFMNWVGKKYFCLCLLGVGLVGTSSFAWKCMSSSNRLIQSLQSGSFLSPGIFQRAVNLLVDISVQLIRQALKRFLVSPSQSDVQHEMWMSGGSRFVSASILYMSLSDTPQDVFITTQCCGVFFFAPLCKYSNHPTCVRSGNAPHSQFSTTEFGFDTSCKSV